MNSGARGATLVEAMMAMMVFVIGVLGLLQANAIASTQNAFAYRQSSAGMIARDLIDSFERLPYSHPAFTVGTHQYQTDFGTDVPLLGASGAVLGSDGIQPNGKKLHQVSWTVSDQIDSATGLAQGRLVQINIAFTIPGAGKKTVTFHTVKYSPTAVVGSPKNFTEI